MPQRAAKYVPGIEGVIPREPTGVDAEPSDPVPQPSTQSALAKFIAALIAAFRRK